MNNSNQYISCQQQVINSLTISSNFLPNDYSWAKPDFHDGPYLQFRTAKTPVGPYATNLMISTHISVGIYTQAQMQNYLRADGNLDLSKMDSMAVGITRVLCDHLLPTSKQLPIQLDFPRGKAYWSPLVYALQEHIDQNKSSILIDQAAK